MREGVVVVVGDGGRKGKKREGWREEVRERVRRKERILVREVREVSEGRVRYLMSSFESRKSFHHFH